MKLGFLQHSLMIFRLHFMLELASRNSQGQVELASWRQNAELRGHKVAVPEMTSRRPDGTNEYIWEEHDHRTQRLCQRVLFCPFISANRAVRSVGERPGFT